MAHFSLEIAHDLASPGAHVAADSEELAPCEINHTSHTMRVLQPYSCARSKRRRAFKRCYVVKTALRVQTVLLV